MTKGEPAQGVTEGTLALVSALADELRQQRRDAEADGLLAVLTVAQQALAPAQDVSPVSPASRPTTRARKPSALLGNLLTANEAGDLIGVSGQTIKRWARAGRVPAYRIGARTMVPRQWVENYARRAGVSLDLDDLADDEAARLVRESRRGTQHDRR